MSNLGHKTGRLHVVDLDVTCQYKMDQALDYVELNLPKLGLWGVVNNAGLGNSGFLEWISVETCEKVKPRLELVYPKATFKCYTCCEPCCRLQL